MIRQEFRSIKPNIRPIMPVALTGPELYTLDNGVQVYTINAGTEDLLKIDLLFEAGSIFQEQTLTAHFTSKCLTEGTNNFGSREIAATVDFYGAYLKAVATKDEGRISLYTLNRHLGTLLPVMQVVALQATFPQDEVETIVKKSRQEFLVNMQKVKYAARHHFGSLIFGESHPYGRFAVEADYDRINRDNLVAFHQKYYRQSPFRIIVAGKLPEDLLELLNRHFGQHTIKRDPEAELHVPQAGPSPVLSHLIERPTALQSAFRIGKPMFNKLHPDYLKFQVLNTLLGGYFGSRLMSNIREDKGYTYGIGSMVSSLKHGGMFVIASETGTDVTGKAIEEVFNELERLHREPVPADELSLVKNYLHGNFLRSADGPFALAELVKGVMDYDLDMDFYRHYLETIKNITAEEIRDLAVKYLEPDSLIRLIVGKKS